MIAAYYTRNNTLLFFAALAVLLAVYLVGYFVGRSHERREYEEELSYRIDGYMLSPGASDPFDYEQDSADNIYEEAHQAWQEVIRADERQMWQRVMEGDQPEVLGTPDDSA